MMQSGSSIQKTQRVHFNSLNLLTATQKSDEIHEHVLFHILDPVSSQSFKRFSAGGEKIQQYHNSQTIERI